MDKPSDEARALLAPWAGPFGGLPPMDRVTPAALEEAVHAAIAQKRAAVRAIADHPAPPDFENTVAALEDSGRALARVVCLYSVHRHTASLGEMPAVAERLAPLLSALDDEIAHDDALFARLQAVWEHRAAAGLGAEQRRLVEVLHQRMRRRGAGLPAAAKGRLAEINARLAALSARYHQNLIAEAAAQAVFFDDAACLDDLPEPLRQVAAAAASERGRPGQWAIPNVRGAVWPFLTHATRRDLRQRVWRMWTDRGDHRGEHDNRPIAAEMLLLRGKLARLLGFPSYAHFALADRMAGAPGVAMALLRRTWASVKTMARAQVADYQAIADRQADEGGPRITLAPWDRLYYAEQLRRERFGLDGEAVRAHLPLEQVLQAIFWAAGRVHGLRFEPVDGAPLIHPTVRVYEARRDGETLPCRHQQLDFTLIRRQSDAAPRRRPPAQSPRPRPR